MNFLKMTLCLPYKCLEFSEEKKTVNKLLRDKIHECRKRGHENVKQEL